MEKTEISPQELNNYILKTAQGSLLSFKCSCKDLNFISNTNHY